MTHPLPVFTPFIVVLCCVAFAQAQEVVRKEAPPGIKVLVGEVVQAVNGTADDFEKFAQARFAPGLLQKHSAADRAALHKRLSDAFGKIGINGIRRRGPDAPLLMQVQGDKSSGEILVELDSSDPPKIIDFSSDAASLAP